MSERDVKFDEIGGGVRILTGWQISKHQLEERAATRDAKSEREKGSQPDTQKK